jgi:AbrB family looped-hinge helix DNA binding protein
MARRTTVTERGQTAIPARIRRETNVQPGTELVWEVVGPDEWRVTVVREQAPAVTLTDGSESRPYQDQVMFPDA